ncbi:MAG TPA: DUF664 domain-containing protein [Mycobacteriales bacterium]|jgi:hypothetical protein
MTQLPLLVDAFGRIREVVHESVDGLSGDDLNYRPDPEANSIAWLVWHLTRVQDDHIAAVAKSEQIWTSGGFADRFGLPLDASATGYGHGPADVEATRIESAELLTEYYDAVHEHTIDYLEHLALSDVQRVVDDRWDPPVTLAVRLVSVLSDDLQHAGQAAYLRGLVTRR